MLLLALSPLLLFVAFIVWGKFKLVWVSLGSLLLALFLVILVWQIRVEMVGLSFVKGTTVAFDILVIIFGALFFLETLKKMGIVQSLCLYLERVSGDYRIQVILLAWFLEGFLEGTAGFGTPSAVVAPLLIGLGLSPIKAVAVALLGNSTSVVFGAAGTPIRVGFAGLNVSGVAFLASLYNLVGFIVPIFMLWFITREGRNGRRDFAEALPFAVVSGLAFVVPSIFFVALGQEFPSIVGSIVGLLIVVLLIRLKKFTPVVTRSLKKENLSRPRISLKRVLFPYIMLVLLLVYGKFVAMGSYYNPGLAFIFSSILTIILFGERKRELWKTLGKSLVGAVEPFLVIALISIMVQLMSNSGDNLSGYDSFLQIITASFKTSLLPFFAPFIGAFGSLLTGSATVANIMFGKILQGSSQTLALLLVGAAAGNMIALADIMPALAVVGLKGQEREIVRLVIGPCLIYVVLVGVLGLIFR